MLFGDRVPVAQKNTARAVSPGIGGMGLDLAQQVLVQGPVVAGGLLVENDQVGPEPAETPIRMSQQQLAHQRQPAVVRNDNGQHRQVA